MCGWTMTCVVYVRVWCMCVCGCLYACVYALFVHVYIVPRNVDTLPRPQPPRADPRRSEDRVKRAFLSRLARLGGSELCKHLVEALLLWRLSIELHLFTFLCTVDTSTYKIRF
jgi:hypothetical protein